MLLLLLLVALSVVSGASAYVFLALFFFFLLLTLAPVVAGPGRVALPTSWQAVPIPRVLAKSERTLASALQVPGVALRRRRAVPLLNACAQARLCAAWNATLLPLRPHQPTFLLRLLQALCPPTSSSGTRRRVAPCLAANAWHCAARLPLGRASDLLEPTPTKLCAQGTCLGTCWKASLTVPPPLGFRWFAARTWSCTWGQMVGASFSFLVVQIV